MVQDTEYSGDHPVRRSYPGSIYHGCGIFLYSLERFLLQRLRTLVRCTGWLQKLYHRDLIRIRKDEANRESLIYGEIREIQNALEPVIAFERIAENGEKIQIWVNMSDETQQADIAEGEILCNNYSETSQKTLNPYQAVMVRCR